MSQIILDSANDLIQGDFDNATLNNRTRLQTTTTNATSNVYVIPNGSATSAGVSISNNSNLTNASKIVMATNGTTDTQIISGVNGSGTYLPLSFYTNNALAAQIDTSANLSVTGRLSFSALSAAANIDGIFLQSGIGTTVNTATGNNITFNTGTTERMRIDSSGNVLVGYSTLPTYSGKLNVNGNISWGDQGGKGRIYSDVNWGCILQGSRASPGASAFLFTNANDTNLVQFNGALGTGTVYSSGGVLTNTNPSDATLKTNVQDLSLGLDFINQLRPVTFDWINDRADQKTQYGFIAQEVQTIEPSIIREFEHIESDDPENIEKSIKLGIEEKAIYTAMVKAIQEQQTIINDLKARIETLEAK